MGVKEKIKEKAGVISAGLSGLISYFYTVANTVSGYVYRSTHGHLMIKQAFGRGFHYIGVPPELVDSIKDKVGDFVTYFRSPLDKFLSSLTGNGGEGFIFTPETATIYEAAIAILGAAVGYGVYRIAKAYVNAYKERKERKRSELERTLTGIPKGVPATANLEGQI